MEFVEEQHSVWSKRTLAISVKMKYKTKLDLSPDHMNTKIQFLRRNVLV